jgi:hypothetical protein
VSEKKTGVIIGVLGLILAIPSAIVALNEIGTIHIFPHLFGGPSSSGCGESGEITLSTASAPRGGSLTVYGSCFEPGELVEIRIHVTSVGSVTANSEGKFTQTVVVPESAPPPSFPTDVVATGHSSLKSGTAPFSTTS